MNMDGIAVGLEGRGEKFIQKFISNSWRERYDIVL
jgi:hypothetical protein